MKRSILVLAVFVVVAAPVIAAVWILIVPQYEAKGEVRVRPIIPRLVFRTEENGVIPFYESFVNTQVSLLRSQTVLQRVLDQPEVQQTQWYKSPGKTLAQQWRGDKVSPLDNLKNGLSARPRPQTEIIDVSFMTVSDKEARIIVDTVLQQYVKYVGESAGATEDKLYRQLTDQYSSLEAEIRSREAVCSHLCRQLGTDTPGELISSRKVRLDETQARLGELRARITVLEWEMKQPGGANDSNGPVDPLQRQPKYHEDAEWRKLDRDVRLAQHQIDKSALSPADPDRAGLLKDLEFAKELRRVREQQLDEQWNDRRDRAGREGGVIPVDRQLARAKVEEQLLRAELEKQTADLDDLFDRAQSLARENAALQHKRELFHAVRSRVDQRNIERNVPGVIEIMAPAERPSKPARDHRILFTAGATLLGLCVAAGAALLTRRTDKVRAESDSAAAV